jgi:pimeloyl-ACP methyl ester carboxylesterase
MLVDLVQVTTRDGLRLDGMLQAPAAGAAPALAVDGFCLVHGTGGNFYSSTLFDAVGERLLQLGCAVLRVNTRGHDGISTAGTARGGQRLGAAYETFDDCRLDLAAWVEWLRQRSGPRVVLIGHSLGAVKCLYALSQEPQLAAGVIAVSPPRLSYEWFCQGASREEFLKTYHQAAKHVEEGQPLALLDVKFPLPFVITAAGYAEKYGPDERTNYLRFLRGVPCPVLVTLGAVEVENNVAFQGSPLELEQLRGKQPRLSVATVPGADHFYTGTRAELVACLERWLRAGFALPGGGV